MKRPNRPRSAPGRLDAHAWLMAARRALIGGGIAAVRVVPLARALGVTTGSFYWHFSSLPMLQDALLKDWETTNTSPLFGAVSAHPGDGTKQFEALADVWIEEKQYDPTWDSAVRDWARVSTNVNAVVRRVDATRIELLHGIFVLLGYQEPEALVRARITYFHQVGYYALRVSESRTVRAQLRPYYSSVLRGDRRNPKGRH